MKDKPLAGPVLRRLGALCVVALTAPGCYQRPRKWWDPFLPVQFERREGKYGSYDAICGEVDSETRSVALSGVSICSGRDYPMKRVAVIARNDALPHARGRNYEVVIIDYRAIRELARWPIEPPEVRPPGAPDEGLHVNQWDSLAISDDGELIAIAYQKTNGGPALLPMITLWEMRSGKLVGVLPLPPVSAKAKRIEKEYPECHWRYVSSLVFSSDRRYLTAYMWWRHRKWDLTPERPDPSVHTYDLKLSGLMPPGSAPGGG